MARTIDNLGFDVSTRYAQDQVVHDENFLKETRVPLQAQIDVTEPSYTSEFDALFDMGKRQVRWASIPPPPGYFEQRARLFSEMTIPKLGSLEKRESSIQRIAQMGKSGNEQIWQTEGKDRDAVLSLLNYLQTLDKTLIDINSKRTQYQRG